MGKLSLKFIRKALERGIVDRFEEYFLDFVDYACSLDVVRHARLNGSQISVERQ